MTNLGRHSVLGAGLLGLMLVVSACGSSTFRADVNRFHQLSAPNGEGAIIVAAEGIESGIEFNTYAELIGARLEGLGYNAAGSNQPDIIVTLAYAALPDPSYRPSSGPTIGIGIGGFGSNVGGGVSTTVDLGDNDTIYHRHVLTLLMDNAASGERLYEGSAQGYAQGANLPSVMPLLVEALFEGWPGASGSTNTVKIETE